MAEFLNVRIQNKYDTYEKWMASSLVLGAGEIAIASIPSGDGTGLTPPAIGIKVGDGSKTFAQLPWIQATAGDVYGWAKAAEKPEYAAGEITGLKEFVEGISDIDTNTEYSFSLAENYKVKIQKKDIGGEYADYQVVDLTSAFAAKADKVTGAVAGNFAGLDANGNLTDSGKKAADFAEAGHNHDEAYAAKAATEAHIAATDVHVQAGERAKWDGASAQAEANKTAIELLNKTDGTVGSVKKTVDDAITALDLANTYAAKGHNHDDKYDAIGAAADAQAAAEAAAAGALAAAKTELEGKITAAQTAAEKVATDLNGAMDTRVKALEEIDHDAYVAADEVLAGRIKTIEDDYLKAADKQALQAQIDTIMNNPDTEGVINSINEFTEYINEHGEIAEGFRIDIDANMDAIEAIKDGAAIDSFADVEAELAKLQVKGDYATKEEAQGYADAKDEAIAAALKAGQDAQGEVDALELVVAGQGEDLAELQEVVEGIVSTGGQANVLEGIAGVEGTLENKTFTVTGVSTDLLKQGTQTIIFNCGTSAV